MCCFADAVQHVSSTQIFAAMSGAEQVLVYEARVATKHRNAMVLPIPIHRQREAVIELLDLSHYPSFFNILSSMFPQPVSGGVGLSPEPERTLAVVRVGAYEASVVPTLEDFSRLSRRFSFAGSRFMPWRKPGLLRVLQERYADHAFVVYQIAEGESRLHPFGLRFTSRYNQLFFPTLHVHDGEAPARSFFDHTLYAQGTSLHEQSHGTVGQLVGGSLPRFVDWNLPVVRGRLGGLLPNQDTFAWLPFRLY